MLGGKLGEPAAPERRQRQPDGSLVPPIRSSPNKPGGLRPVHQLHHAVVAEQQMASHVSDGGASRVEVAPHREEKLVLRRGQARGLGLVLAPSQEPTKPVSQAEEVRVIGVGQACRGHSARIYMETGSRRGGRRPLVRRQRDGLIYDAQGDAC